MSQRPTLTDDEWFNLSMLGLLDPSSDAAVEDDKLAFNRLCYEKAVVSLLKCIAWTSTKEESIL